MLHVCDNHILTVIGKLHRCFPGYVIMEESRLHSIGIMHFADGNVDRLALWTLYVWLLKLICVLDQS